jgi:hypothetical protein
MNKIIFFIILLLPSLAFGDSNKDVFIAMENCSDKNYDESLKAGWKTADIPNWEKDNRSFGRPLVKDKYILEYESNFPINFIEHNDIILERRRKLTENYFTAIYNASNQVEKDMLNQFENNYPTKQSKNYTYWDKRRKIYNNSTNALKSSLVILAKEKKDKNWENETTSTSAWFLAIANSKNSIFNKMTVKEKLQIKDYKKFFFNCEQDYNKGKITFLSEWED